MKFLLTLTLFSVLGLQYGCNKSDRTDKATGGKDQIQKEESQGTNVYGVDQDEVKTESNARDSMGPSEEP